MMLLQMMTTKTMRMKKGKEGRGVGEHADAFNSDRNHAGMQHSLMTHITYNQKHAL